MAERLWELAVLAALIFPCEAWAQNLPDCDLDTARVVEASAQVAGNDFNGVKQTVVGGAITRSTCMGDSVNRFRLELSGAFVDEAAGNAGVVLVGVGVELRPLGSEPELTVTPLARVGYEHFAGRGDRLILGGALTVEDVIWQKTEKRGSGKDAYEAPLTQIILGGVVEYTDRRTAGTGAGSFLILPDARATFGGNIAVDQTLGHNLRGRATGGYQVLGRGPVSGYGYLELGLRPVNDRQSDYRWNFSLRASRGDGGYKGLLIGLSRRFSSARK